MRLTERNNDPLADAVLHCDTPSSMDDPVGTSPAAATITAPQRQIADPDGDGTISVKDAAAILKASVGSSLSW